MTSPSTPMATGHAAAPAPAHTQTATRAALSYRTMLLALMLLGLGLRIWFVLVNELQPIYSPADDGDYYQRALRFATTGLYIDDFWLIRPPLHVVLFALLIRVSILLGNVDGLLLIRAFQIGMITLTIPLGYGLASRLFNRTAGVIFAGILAVWFPFVELSAHLFSEPTFFFFLLLHLWLLVRWRDTRRWTMLALSGIALGYGALARSPTIYGLVFVFGWLVLESHHRRDLAAHPDTAADAAPPEPGPLVWLRAQWQAWWGRLRTGGWWRLVLRHAAIFGLFCAVIVLPWTLRNYLVYDRFILVDTIGSVNLWLHLEKYPEKGVEILKTIPQADRHVFAVEDTRRIFERDPQGFWGLLWRNAGFHFQHIWKAQFAEDFLTKPSFYGRPLRDFWLLGALGDLIWFTFTLTGLVALMAPPREGAFRLIALGWVSYTIVAMMIMHIEPRYLFPIWLFLALYGSWALSNPGGMLRMLRQAHRRPNIPTLHGLLALLVAAVFLTVFLTYRNYPAMIADGYARETHNAAGVRAYNEGDYATAEAEFRAALAAHSTFTETRANLALALIAQGRYDEARELLGSRDAQHIMMARAALARAEGNLDAAADYFIDAEKRAGMNMQQFGLWLDAPPTRTLHLGTGRDLGYISGFSSVERIAAVAASDSDDSTTLPYRWLQGQGRIRLPLEQPLQAGSTVALRMTAGQPATVPLRVTFANGETVSVQVRSGRWRVYHLAVPHELAGQQQLDLHLDAPIFIPAHTLPGSVDTRPLSLMIGRVVVE